MSDTTKRPTFCAAIYYKDPFAALDWLEQAFGFERTMVITSRVACGSVITTTTRRARATSRRSSSERRAASP